MNIDRQTRTARRYVFTTPAFIAIRWRQAHVFNFHLAAKHTASIEDCKYYYKISEPTSVCALRCGELRET